MNAEDETLARAQAELERRRAGLDRERLDRLRGRGGIGNVAAALGSGLAAAEVQLVGACPCGGKLARPAPAALALCPSCLSREAEVERRRVLLERIPERYRWADLSRPLVPPGGVEPVVPDAARERAAAWLRGRKRVLTIAAKTGVSKSTSGAGKSSLAGAVARGAIEAGEAPVWVHAIELSPMRDRARAEAAYQRIVRARFAVVDGLGKELGTAGEGRGEGVAAQRVELTSALMQELHARGNEGPRIVWTVDLTGAEVESVYDGAALRRLIDPSIAECIVLQRLSKFEGGGF